MNTSRIKSVQDKTVHVEKTVAASPIRNARDKLIDAAHSAIRYKGYSATSVDALCRIAGVTKGAFFHHFASKEALAVAAAGAWTERAEELIFTLPAWTKIDDPLDRYLGHIDFRLAMLDGPIEAFTCFVGTMVQEAYATNDPIRAACDASISAYSDGDRKVRYPRRDHGDQLGKPYTNYTARRIHYGEGKGQPRHCARKCRTFETLCTYVVQKRRARMTDYMPNPAEYGMHGLCPHLVCKGAAGAMDFYKKAFDAAEMMRLPGLDGRLMHGSLQINGCMVMIADEFTDVLDSHRNAAPTTLGGTSVILHLQVDDCDAWAARAVSAGAKTIMPMADMFWGDRYGQIEDPWGHRWSIATPKGTPVMSEDLTNAMNKAMEG
jgi:uncharacterized glyoxalase superfamily protein PhnB